jgi:hypothetical protein
MPRINFIPPPIDFNDRGAALVNPIMANAMQLAETFTTEVPHIRMQQEAAAEDRRRYDDSLRMRQEDIAYRRERDRIGDQRYADEMLRNRLASTNALLMPDAIDTNGDGTADVAGVGAGAGRAPRLSIGAERPGSDAALELKKMELELKKRNLDMRERLALENMREDYIKSRTAQFATAEEASSEFDRMFPRVASALRSTSSAEVGNAPTQGGGAVELNLAQAEDAGTELSHDSVAAATHPQHAPVAIPTYTPIRREMALAALDNLKMIPERERLAAGGYSDQQIELLKSHIVGHPQTAPQPQAPEAPVVTEAPAVEQPPVEPPVAHAPVATIAPPPQPVPIQTAQPEAVIGDLPELRRVVNQIRLGERVRNLQSDIGEKQRWNRRYLVPDSTSGDAMDPYAQRHLGPGERLLMRVAPKPFDAKAILAALPPRGVSVKMDLLRDVIENPPAAPKFSDSTTLPGVVYDRMAHAKAMEDWKARILAGLERLGY